MLSCWKEYPPFLRLHLQGYSVSCRIVSISISVILHPTYIFFKVCNVKLTIPLRREKATSNCGELQIELDDLHVTMGSGSPVSETSESQPLNSVPSTSNHVATTSETPETLANNLGTLITLDTPESGRRSQEGAASQEHPSPTTTPTPGAVGRGGVASTVGVASVGGSVVTGGGRGSGTSSPAAPVPSSQSQQNVRTRSSSSLRPSPIPPSISTPSQPRPSTQQQQSAGHFPMVVNPPQQAASMCFITSLWLCT
jgi:hypothetical protein